MSRSRKSSRKSKTGSRARPKAQSSSASHEKRPAAQRSIIRDTLFGIIVCLAFFGMVEAGLRLAGIPMQDPGEDPFVGFASLKPLYSVENGVARTSESRLEFFNEATFKVEKPAGTTRIFCFGGSTTYGRPFDGRTAFPRWLGELLNASAPDRRFEVINAGGISYASYRIVPLVREVLAFQPDLVIIYTGHNEFLERRTYSGVSERGEVLVTLESQLDRLNTYRLLKRILEPAMVSRRTGGKSVPGSRSSSNTGRGPDRAAAPASDKRQILHDEVTAILDQSAGLDIYHRDERFSRGVVQHFAINLRRMLAVCRNAKVPVMVIEPACNLKDFSPFKSEHGSGLDKSAREEVKKTIEEARKLIEKGEFAPALEALERVVQSDPLYAMAHYWMGRALYGLGRRVEGQKSFVRARDLDVCPLRCISPLLRHIREISLAEGAPFVDFPAILAEGPARHSDAAGVPGNESFMDHVHPTIQCHQLLAEHILSALADNGLVRLSKKLTADKRHALYKTLTDGLDATFFATKDLNLAKVLRWAGKKEEAWVALLRAAKELHDHPEIHKMMGSHLMDKGDYAQAISEYQQAVKLSGNDPRMIYSLAVAYHDSGAVEDAVRMYREMVDSEADIPEAYSNLAMIHLERGRVQEALKVAKAGVDRDLRSGAILAAYGLALAISGDAPAGIPWMLKALEIEPGDGNRLYNLAGMYALVGKHSEAINSLESALRNGYRNRDKIAGDPVFSSLRSDPRFQELLSSLR